LFAINVEITFGVLESPERKTFLYLTEVLRKSIPIFGLT